MQIHHDTNDSFYEELAKFRIHHGLSSERAKQLSTDDLTYLWINWMGDRGIPCGIDEEANDWVISDNHFEAFMHCLCIFQEDQYIGDLEIIKPASPELQVLLSNKAA